MAKRGLSKCKQSKSKGTGNILQDLLCCSVFIQKLKFNHHHPPLRCSSEGSSDSIMLDGDQEGLCSICYGDKVRVIPTTEKEMNILQEVVFKSWRGVENNVTCGKFSWICIHCSATLERLDKCRRQMEDIVFCIRTIIRMKMDRGRRSNMVAVSNEVDVSLTNVTNCLRNKRIEGDFVKINESNLDVVNPVVRGQITSTTPPLVEFEITDIDTDEEDDEESIMMGIEGDQNGDRRRDLLTAEGRLEPSVLVQVQGGGGNGHGSDGSLVTQEDGVKLMNVHQKEIVKDKPTCEECGKTFTSKSHLIRHQKNKRIHKRQSQQEFRCKTCRKRFLTLVTLRRHECDENIDKLDGEELKPVVVNLEFDIMDEDKLENVETDMAHIDGQQLFSITTQSISDQAKNIPQHIVQSPQIITDDLRSRDITQIQQYPLDTTEQELINRVPLTVHTCLRNKGTATANESDLDEPNTLLRRLTCNCPICAGIDASTFLRQILENDGEKKTQNLCHIPGCGKVYNNLGDHLRCAGENPFVCLYSNATGAVGADLAKVDGEVSSNNEITREELSVRLGRPGFNSTENSESQECVNVEVNNVEIRPKRQSRARAEDKIQSLTNAENASDSEDEDDDVSDSDYEGQAATSDSDNSLAEIEVENKPVLPLSFTKCPNSKDDKCRENKTKHSQGNGEPPRCDPCNKTFKLPRDYRRHVLTRKHATVLGEPLRCDPCNKTFKLPRDYRKHVLTMKHATMLGEEGVTELERKRCFKCEKCDKRFFSAARLQTHKYNHNFICETCGKQYPTTSLLQQHQDSHTRPRKVPNRFIDPKDKRISCKKCGKRFADKSGMFRHLKVIHKGHRYKCDLCPKDFAGLQALGNHKKKIHSKNEAKPKPTKSRVVDLERVQCEMCSKTFALKAFMVRHIELAHFPMQSSCPYGCNDIFGTKQEWITHLEQCKSGKMTDESKCYCFFCGELFSNQLLRISHHLDLHTTYPCEFCSARFTRKDVLHRHNDSHEESKPHLCSKCGKRFKQLINLRYHSTTVCGNDDDARNELITKRRELHRIFREKKKPHKCDICSKGFVEERRLAAHKLKKHGDKDESSEDETEDDDGA